MSERSQDRRRADDDAPLSRLIAQKAVKDGGFLVRLGKDRHDVRIPVFQHPLLLVHASECEERIARLKIGIARWFEIWGDRSIPRGARDETVLISALFQRCASFLIERAKLGDPTAVSALIQTTSDVAQDIQRAQGKFNKAVCHEAALRLKFPVLTGKTRASLNETAGFLDNLGLGSKAVGERKKDRKAANVSGQNASGFAYSILEYIDDLRRMQVLVGEEKLDEKLFEAGVSKALFAQLRLLPSFDEASAAAWRAVAVDYLTGRFGSLENALAFSSPASQLKRSFTRIAKGYRFADKRWSKNQ